MQSVAYTFLYIRCEALYYLNGENAWGSKLFDTPSYMCFRWNSYIFFLYLKKEVNITLILKFGLYKVHSAQYFYQSYKFADFLCIKWEYACLFVFEFYVPPTSKVIQRRDLCLKTHPKVWRSPGSNSRPLVYEASSLTTKPRRLQRIRLCFRCKSYMYIYFLYLK